MILKIKALQREVDNIVKRENSDREELLEAIACFLNYGGVYAAEVLFNCLYGSKVMLLEDEVFADMLVDAIVERIVSSPEQENLVALIRQNYDYFDEVLPLVEDTLRDRARLD